MQQSKSQLSLAPSSIAQSVSALSTHELSSHAYWLLKKKVEHLSIEKLEEKGKKEILWTGEPCHAMQHLSLGMSHDINTLVFTCLHWPSGLRAPLDTENAKLIRSEDPILLCAISNEEAVITGILEATCEHAALFSAGHNLCCFELLSP